MSEVLKRRMRCAVYTRKSTDEGLDQEYNSIDAQRDTGHAYIASQHAEGWIPVADDYDGPAFSGGHMERPALRRMMADIEAGKIDRLTRSGEIATRGRVTGGLTTATSAAWSISLCWRPTSLRPFWTTHCRTASRCSIWRLIRRRCGMSSGCESSFEATGLTPAD